MATITEVETPFSPCSFEFHSGDHNNGEETKVKQTFRFAGAPDGPLPSIPSGEEDSESESEPEIVLRRKAKTRRAPEVPVKKTTWNDFPFLSLVACILCTSGGILFAVAIHKVFFKNQMIIILKKTIVGILN